MGVLIGSYNHNKIKRGMMQAKSFYEQTLFLDYDCI